MAFDIDEIVRVRAGSDDKGHANERGRVIGIKYDSAVLVADYPVGGESEKGAYEVVFSPVERWTEKEWYCENELEKI